MVPLIAFICVLESVRQRKSFPTEKRPFFLSFKCLICEFSQNFLLYNSVWIRIQIRTFTDSDPTKIIGFFRIRTWLLNTGQMCGPETEIKSFTHSTWLLFTLCPQKNSYGSILVLLNGVQFTFCSTYK
jgi:hypothetical protein